MRWFKTLHAIEDAAAHLHDPIASYRERDRNSNFQNSPDPDPSAACGECA